MLSRKGPGSSLTKGKKSFDGKVSGDRGNNKSLSMDVARLLKTQDMGYVRTVRNALRKDVERLRKEVVLARGEDAVRRDVEGGQLTEESHIIVFAESVEERDQLAGINDDAEDEEEEEEGENGGEGEFGGFDDDYNEDVMDVEDDDGPDRKGRRAKGKHRRRLERELEAKEKQLKALDQTEHELNVEKAKMAKTATSGGFKKGGKRIKVTKRKR
jgi:U3 small nucleolar RNA-associated protein 11